MIASFPDCTGTSHPELPKIVTGAVPGPKSFALAARLEQVESPDTTFLSPDFPVFWESAHGCLVTDVDGNTYLDAASSFGAMSVGHTHPEVVEAVQAQAARLMHGMGDVHPSRVKVELLELIAAHSPVPDPRIILGQSGAEAVEAALKTAALATGRSGVLAFQGGYHGLTYGTLEPTARPAFRDPFSAQRGRFAEHLPYGCEIELIRELLSDPHRQIGAVIVEPIQGRGGIRIPPPGWIAAIGAACREFGTLLVLDEIYTGWGRTGSLFACEWEGVVPDLICVGKAMGGGMPLSACIGSRSLIERAWPKSTGEALHTSTFLGHPLACAGALAAIRVIVRDDLAARAERLGSKMLAYLSVLAQQYPESIADVRGRGLMIGVEMRSPEIARACLIGSLQRGLILLLAGDDGSVVELTPPLILSSEQATWCAQQLASCLDDLRHKT